MKPDILRNLMLTLEVFWSDWHDVICGVTLVTLFTGLVVWACWAVG